MQEVAREQGAKDVRDALSACTELAGSDATAKKACFSSAEMKRAIANNEGGTATTFQTPRSANILTTGPERAAYFGEDM